MHKLVAIANYRHPLYILFAAGSFVALLVRGPLEVPWMSALLASVTVGCVVMVAKGPATRTTGFVGVALLLAVEILTWLAVWRYGFTAGFCAWGVAHLAAIGTSTFMVAGAAGAALTADSETEVADWIASRGFVFGVASLIGVVALAP